MIGPVETTTGRLFGGLWGALTEEQYRESIALFEKRFTANGFDLGWFKGKRCLDAGTGSGRYAAAMSTFGAKVVGVDVSESGIEVARERTRSYPGLEFVHGSVLDLPFNDNEFDFVCCAGVLHHTPSIEKGLSEIHRVLKPGGRVFLLLYGAGGLRWKQVAAVRPLVMEIGADVVDAAIGRTGLPANNRKHFMDDLFVPIQTLIAWTELSTMMATRGFGDLERWTKGRFDHEASPEAQLSDMEKIARICHAIEGNESTRALGNIASKVADAFVDEARRLIGDQSISRDMLEQIVIGEGNHRVIAVKA